MVDYFTPLKHLSRSSLFGGLVIKLTTIVIIKANGKAIIMESTVGQGAVVTNTALPVSALQIPSASADFLYSNTSQNTLIIVPITSPEITPSLVERFQKQAKVYMVRKAAAVILNHMAVPTAIMLVGNRNHKMTAIITAMVIPTRATNTDDLLIFFLRVPYTSSPRAVPCTWNWAESVDMAAESNVIMKR